MLRLSPGALKLDAVFQDVYTFVIRQKRGTILLHTCDVSFAS